MVILMRKILTILTIIVLVILISGCINPNTDINPTTKTITTTKTVTQTGTLQPSHTESGQYHLTSYRVLQENDLPFKVQVISLMEGKTTITLAIRITKTSNYKKGKEYYIDVITSFNHELLRIVHYSDNLKMIRKYNCENDWCEGVEFKYTGGNGAIILVVFGDKNFNILTNNYKYYDSVKIGYFIKNSEYSKIFLGRSTIQLVYS